MCNCQYCQQKCIRDEGSTVDAKKPIKDGILMTAVASTTAGIFYALRMAGVGQHNTLLVSTSLAWLISLPVWKMQFFDMIIKRTYIIK